MLAKILPLVFLAGAALAEDATYTLKIKDHKLEPGELKVASGESFWLEIANEDATTEEFESNSLKLEKIIPPRRTIKLKVKSIAEGTHDMFGEFHPDSCKGTITATKGATP